jgi:hypothetical protein
MRGEPPQLPIALPVGLNRIEVCCTGSLMIRRPDGHLDPSLLLGWSSRPGARIRRSRAPTVGRRFDPSIQILTTESEGCRLTDVVEVQVTVVAEA